MNMADVKRQLEQNEEATDPPLVSPLAVVLLVALAVAHVALMHEQVVWEDRGPPRG